MTTDQTADPIDPEGPQRRLSAINPGAGQHAMPARETDLARALRCAEAAWGRFPYLAMRYGDRGRRFTNSDSCWLVSLYDLEESLVIKNLQWLRTVLASRGLPTMILEDHLRKIDADVAAHERERWQGSTGFRSMLDQLQAQRSSVLDQPRHDALVAQWRPRFDACSGERVPDAADLLISARVDTASGIERAWEATRSWFIDPERFSREWIDNVHGLTVGLERVVDGGSA